MRDVRPVLQAIRFPPLQRDHLHTLQLNVTYRCNLSCTHCHVNAGPHRTEQMSTELLEVALLVAERHGVRALDLTGGSPEMHPGFKRFVREARQRGFHLIDRLNATLVEEPGYEWIPGFLAENEVEVVASLPCHGPERVDAQRGQGVFAASIRVLRQLNELGYGRGDPSRILNLMYNPSGAFLPPAQTSLEQSYRERLMEDHGVAFDRLHVLTNMPVQRFGAVLAARGELDAYLDLLQGAHREANLAGVMCRGLVSVDWRGRLYDCDFNQMLDWPICKADGTPIHLSDLLNEALPGPVRTAGHCYGCTAGQGSSCGGAVSVETTVVTDSVLAGARP
jgi:radical SAM/Cys-rich protein